MQILVMHGPEDGGNDDEDNDDTEMADLDAGVFSEALQGSKEETIYLPCNNLPDVHC